jgi:pimeloyl-ACP methyl ester carboxylesterase
MYLKNNKIFIYVFIITTLAYHEQFLSVNINDKEEKISEEYYCKGCCNCNIFTVNPPFTNKDLIDNFAPNNQIGTLGKMLILLGLGNKKKIDNKGNNKKDSKLLALHELLTSDFDLKKNTELEEENLEDYEKNNNQVNMDNNDYKKKITKFKKETEELNQVSVLCKYKKTSSEYDNFTYVDLDRKIGRFIKIKNRIPCLFFQTILQTGDQNVPNFQPKQHKSLIIYFHGLGDSIANYFEIAAYTEETNNFEKTERQDINALLDKGFDLAIIEYKGGGYYDGDCDEEDFRNNDARDIFNFFSQLYKNNEIITLGYSLGCAFASQFTAKAEEIIKKQNNCEKKNRIKACILIYPFINIKQAGKHIFETLGGWWGNHFSWIINPILKLRFDNKKWVSNIHSNLLLVNNKNDVMCNEKSIMPLKDAFLAGGGGELYIQELDKGTKIYMNQEKYLYIIESNSNDHFYINWQEVITFLEFLGDQYTFKTK